MKKNLFILLLFAFINCFSQAYTPLLKDGNKWWVYYSEGYCDMCNAQFKASYVFINGETTVNGIVYKRVYSNLYYVDSHGPYGTQGGSGGIPYYYTNNPDVFECLMREDILTKKVYFLDSNTNTEKLMYDFSAQIGDIITSDWRWSGGESSIAVGDIVRGSVFGRENVKTFKTSGNIYEGIGSQSGLFVRPASQQFELGYFWLDCFEDTTGKSCGSQFVALGISENSVEKNLTLYYSKENRDFKILGNSSLDYKVSFYEATGKLIQEISTKGKQNFSLKSTGENKILFYTITNKDKSWKGKIMIQ